MITAIQFPDIFSSGGTKIIYDKKATKQNLKLLLLSTKQSLLGDPNYGTNLKKLIFEQNNAILRDIVIDDIYTNIKIFLPQIEVQRKNIELNSDGNTLQVTVRAKNLIDYNFEDITLSLYSLEEAK